MSGTNAHVIWRKCQPGRPRPRAPKRPSELVVLSAKSEASLNAQAGRLTEHLRARPEIAAWRCGLQSCYDTQRAGLSAGDCCDLTRDAAKAGLEVAEQGQTPPGAVRGTTPSTRVRPRWSFLFTGHGSQWLGMGRQLLVHEPVFRDAMSACDRAIFAEAGFSVLGELAAEPADSHLSRLDIVQPVLFAMAVALAALWRSWGVTPDAVVGHSMGEIAAAHVAGALCLEDAVATHL